MDEAERCGRVGYIYLSKLIAVGPVEQLRRMPEANPPGTQRVEIDSANASAALQAVRAANGVREATIFGRSIHALVDDTPGTLERLASRVDQAGFGPVHIQPIESSLEDVFVTLTNHTDARRQAGARQ
jgi:ABC-2 type transport system ATP-binding protein